MIPSFASLALLMAAFPLGLAGQAAHSAVAAHPVGASRVTASSDGVSSRWRARVGLLVVAHGADSGWNARVRATVSQVVWDGPVRLAYLMGPEAHAASWSAGVTALERAGIDSLVVVPLMVSSYGAHFQQIQHYAGYPVPLPAALGGHDHGPAVRPGVPVRVTPALDAAEELGEILHDRWGALPAASRAAPLVLVAHGPTTDADAGRWVDAITRAVTPRTGALLHVGLLRDDAPPPVRAAAVAAIRDTIVALARRHGDSVTVMTVLMSHGGINRTTVPADLAGMPMRYAGVALAPHPALARWITRIARR